LASSINLCGIPRSSLVRDEPQFRSQHVAELVESRAQRIDGGGYPRNWPAVAIAVQYKGGYDQIPADIQDAALRMVRARWLGRNRDPLLRQESIPGVRDVTYWVPAGDSNANMPPDVADILDNHRAPVVAA
jgi:hypothetical protein